MIRTLARARPALTLTLLTFCLDDSSIELYRFGNGRTKKWEYPEDRREFHWDRARAKFGLAGEDVYDDDEPEHWAEEEMLHEAWTHWDRISAGSRSVRPRRYRWWSKPRHRDLATGKRPLLYEIAARADSKPPPRRSSSSRPPRSTERAASEQVRVKFLFIAGHLPTPSERHDANFAQDRRKNCMFENSQKVKK